MPRYIDAEELRRRVKEKTNPYGKPTLDYESGVKVLNMIDNAPTADVAPKIEGEWVQSEDWEYDYRCSSCGNDALEGRYGNNDLCTKFCPCCGAHMKGGAE